MSSPWTAPIPDCPAPKPRGQTHWPAFWLGFNDALATCGTIALVGLAILWLSILPSVGFLWLVGWLP